MEKTTVAEQSAQAKVALRFIVLLGIVSLNADMTSDGEGS
jgi:hypothetical protein